MENPIDRYLQLLAQSKNKKRGRLDTYMSWHGLKGATKKINNPIKKKTHNMSPPPKKGPQKRNVIIPAPTILQGKTPFVFVGCHETLKVPVKTRKWHW